MLFFWALLRIRWKFSQCWSTPIYREMFDCFVLFLITFLHSRLMMFLISPLRFSSRRCVSRHLSPFPKYMWHLAWIKPCIFACIFDASFLVQVVMNVLSVVIFLFEWIINSWLWLPFHVLFLLFLLCMVGILANPFLSPVLDQWFSFLCSAWLSSSDIYCIYFFRIKTI